MRKLVFLLLIPIMYINSHSQGISCYGPGPIDAPKYTFDLNDYSTWKIDGFKFWTTINITREYGSVGNEKIDYQVTLYMQSDSYKYVRGWLNTDEGYALFPHKRIAPSNTPIYKKKDKTGMECNTITWIGGATKIQVFFVKGKLKSAVESYGAFEVIFGLYDVEF